MMKYSGKPINYHSVTQYESSSLKLIKAQQVQLNYSIQKSCRQAPTIRGRLSKDFFSYLGMATKAEFSNALRSTFMFSQRVGVSAQTYNLLDGKMHGCVCRRPATPPCFGVHPPIRPPFKHIQGSSATKEMRNGCYFTLSIPPHQGRWEGKGTGGTLSQ